MFIICLKNVFVWLFSLLINEDLGSFNSDPSGLGPILFNLLTVQSIGLSQDPILVIGGSVNNC